MKSNNGIKARNSKDETHVQQKYKPLISRKQKRRMTPAPLRYKMPLTSLRRKWSKSGNKMLTGRKQIKLPQRLNKTTMSGGQCRLFLWAVPRSISTAFFRAMMNRSNTKVLLEPYSRAYYFSTERVSKRYENEPVQDGCTYREIKGQLEEPFPDAEVVFVKDMAYYLINRLDTICYLPDNYIHTFLIRDPKKSVYSLYKMSLNKELTGWDHFDASEVGFEELYKVFQMVTEELGQEAIVVDADDLLKHPEDMLRQYCQKVGVDFQDSMLNWDDAPKEMTLFQDWMPWFEGVLTSKTFQPSATKPKSPNVMPDLPRHVLKAIDDNKVFYNKLFAVRLRPNSLSH